MTGAIADSRHASYVTHPLHDLLSQRVFQIASGYEDGAERLLAGHPNDANTLRRDPLFKLAAGTLVERLPSEREAEETALGPRIRYQHAVSAAHWSSEDACWTVSVTRTVNG